MKKMKAGHGLRQAISTPNIHRKTHFPVFLMIRENKRNHNETRKEFSKPDEKQLEY